MKISNKGLDLLKYFEGLRLEPYKDSAGLLTIGYGHLMKAGEDFPLFTKEKANSLLHEDLIHAEKAINIMVKHSLTQTQFDALVCFVFNVGVRNFQYSTLLKSLNQGEFLNAAKQFLVWNKVSGKINKGLTNRRQQEQTLFLQKAAILAQ